MTEPESDPVKPPIWTGHVVAYCSDPRSAADFYISLGMREVAVMGDFAVLELAGGTHLAIRRGPERAGVALDFDLMVEDLDATHAAWAEAGHKVSEITDGAIHRQFVLEDVDGNTVEVCDSHVVGPV
jgi:catechol 2,3-dioxygenase-like lactoylglutathione lyase family enzyme